MMAFLTRATVLVALTCATACTIKETEIPPLTGPSEFGLSVTIAALPDLIVRNGTDQALIVVTARNPSGSPVAGVQFRLDTIVGLFYQDFGTFQSRFITTGADGRATGLYTAPPAPPSGTSSVIDRVTIIAAPVGTNQQAVVPQRVEIRLVPPSTNNPGAPIAFFTYSPSTVTTATLVNFNASQSYPVSGTSLINYAWDWGDNTVDNFNTSPNEDHDWASPGAYTVTLTVTDNLGQKGSTSQVITVG